MASGLRIAHARQPVSLTALNDNIAADKLPSDTGPRLQAGASREYQFNLDIDTGWLERVEGRMFSCWHEAAHPGRPLFGRFWVKRTPVDFCVTQPDRMLPTR
jgi:hypothetical protein